MAFLCVAHQESDQKVCEKCGLVWDMNDSNPPFCGEVYRKSSRALKRSRQTKLESTIEIASNIGSGFFISMVLYRFVVFPYMLKMGAGQQAFWITLLFTVTSVIRSYVWRRFFNAELHKIVHQRVGRFVAWCASIKSPKRTQQTAIKRTKKRRV